MLSQLLIFSYYFTAYAESLNIPHDFISRPLIPDKKYSCCKNEPYVSHRDLPVIYCYQGHPKTPVNTWLTVSAILDLSPEQYELYEGFDSTEVWEQFDAHRSSWSFNFINFRPKHVKLDPFNSTCLGIQTSQDYTIRLQVKQVDYLRVAIFAAGVFLFFLSPSLANNPLFYYLTGITFGMLASVLVLFYFVLKLLPLKTPTLVGMMAGGSTIVLYLFQTFYDNILVILVTYYEYVVGYLLLSALISFIICYRFGPVSNPRSKNLIQWALQAFSLILTFASSHLHEMMVAVNLGILTFYIIPIFRWIGSAAKFSSRVVFSRKPRVRLLSQEEYRVQGEHETAQGLQQLRDYCNSPACKQWVTVMRLRDPHRFARFMEGKSHVTRGEMELYEEESKMMMDELLTDDSGSEED